MKKFYSRTGLIFLGIYLSIIPVSIILVPFSLGYSLIFIARMALPWSWIVSLIPYLGITDWNKWNVLAGVLINIPLIYMLGRALEKRPAK